MRSGDGVRLLMQTLMMKNQERQGKKDALSMANAFNPVDYQTQQTDTNFQFADTTGQAVRDKANQGLLSSGVLGNMGEPTSANLGQGLLGSNPQQTNPMQNNYQFTNPMDQYSKSNPNNQVTTTTTTKELGMNDINKQIRSEWQKKVQADIKGMSADGARQYMATARQTLQEQLGQVKDDYKNSQIEAYVSKLPPEMQNMVQLTKMGIPDVVLKRLFPEESRLPGSVAPGHYVRDPNSPNGYTQIGTPNKSGGRTVQLANGNIGVMQPDGSVQDTGTAFYQRPPSGNGRTTADDKDYNKKWAQYKWAVDYDIVSDGVDEITGKEKTRRVQRNPELAKRLEAELFNNGQGSGQPQPQANNDDAAASYDRVWRQIKAENPAMSDEDVTGYVTYIIQQNGG
jgi:hypothetical protein